MVRKVADTTLDATLDTPQVCLIWCISTRCGTAGVLARKRGSVSHAYSDEGLIVWPIECRMNARIQVQLAVCLGERVCLL